MLRRLEDERPSEYAEYMRIDTGVPFLGASTMLVPNTGGYDLDGYVPGSGVLPGTTADSGTSGDEDAQGATNEDMSESEDF